MTQHVSHFRPPKVQRRNWSMSDRAKLQEMWLSGAKIGELSDTFGRSPGCIYYKASQMGLPRRIGGGKAAKPQAAPRKRGRPAKPGSKASRKYGGTQRRHKLVDNSSGPRVILESHDPRSRAGITIFPTSVIPASQLPRLLKSGVNSRKIGGKMEKGRWKGQPVYTLTLEERATCPRSCKEWATCYGNNMPFAQRIYDDGTFTKRLWAELAVLSVENPSGFVLRLHVLGDFYSVEYVDFWRQALNDFPALNVFGFSARMPPDPIGNRLVHLVADFYERFRIRFSGAGYETDCSEVVDRPEDATGLRCPAETDPERCCASCGLCMQTNRTISFVRH